MTEGSIKPGMVEQDPVVVVIPAHDEAAKVAEVIGAVRAQGYPVLLVDDGSTDGTGERAREAGAEVLRLEPNRGKGAALKAGFREALAKGYKAVLTLDADGQHPPDKIPAFLRAGADSGADLVVGAREFADMPPFRRLTNTLARWLFSWAVGRRIPDNQSGYRLQSARLVEAAISSPEQGFAFEVEVLALCLGRGYRLIWIPIPTVYGQEKSDIRPWNHLVSFIRVTRRARRLVQRERGSMLPRP